MTNTLAQQLQELHKHTTQGTWTRGETSHHIASNKGAGKPYKVAEFRHADDAQFCEFVHNNMPAILEALGAWEFIQRAAINCKTSEYLRLLEALGISHSADFDFDFVREIGNAIANEGLEK